MAYVPGSRFDIFVSYAHVDDTPPAGAPKGWVTTLVGEVERELFANLGRPDENLLWMDPKLTGNEPLSDQITDAVADASVLLLVLSPGYLKSTWCEREKNTFLRRVQDLVHRSRSRVFVIERAKVENRPEEFGNLKGYPFWVVKERGQYSTLGHPLPDPGAGPDYWEYHARVGELAKEIARELQALKQPVSTQPSAAAQPRPCVFLAEVTDDLEARRDEMKRYLDQSAVPGESGVKVLPEALYPADPTALRRELERDLAQCKLFVQLLSDVPGKRRPDLPQGIVQFQYELAKTAGKEILQWCPPSTDIEAIADAEHKQFLKLGTVRKEGIESFKKFVRDRAYTKPEPAARKKMKAFVFVDSEVHDTVLARKIFDELVEYGQGATLPRRDGKPREIRKDLEWNLANCDALIIVYGTSTAAWVGEQLKQCRKVLQKRDSDLLALAVYQGPPETKEPLDIALPNMRVIDCRNGFSSERLRSFIDGVAAGS